VAEVGRTKQASLHFPDKAEASVLVLAIEPGLGIKIKLVSDAFALFMIEVANLANVLFDPAGFCSFPVSFLESELVTNNH